MNDKTTIALTIILTFLVTNVFYFIIDVVFYLSNLQYLIEHIAIHFDNGCIYNGDSLICTN